jgi:hypothetical protein
MLPWHSRYARHMLHWLLWLLLLLLLRRHLVRYLRRRRRRRGVSRHLRMLRCLRRLWLIVYRYHLWRRVLAASASLGVGILSLLVERGRVGGLYTWV